MTLPDIIGLIGVGLILLAYGALQFQKLDPLNWRYSAMNGLGAALILVSLYFDFNLSAVVIEGAWVLISAYGLWRAWRVRKL